MVRTQTTAAVHGTGTRGIWLLSMTTGCQLEKRVDFLIDWYHNYTSVRPLALVLSLFSVFFECLGVQLVVELFSRFHVILETCALRLHIVEKNVALEAILWLPSLTLMNAHLLFYDVLHGVILLQCNQFVEFYRLIELVGSKSLGLFDETRLLNVVHHTAISWRELIFNLTAQFMLVLLRLGNLQEGVSLKEFAE